MIRLVGAELQRLRSRRLSLVMVIVALAAVALFQVALHFQVAPSAAAQARAQQAYSTAHSAWEGQHDQNVAECVQQGGGSQADCESYDPEPTPADYAVEPPPFDQVAPFAVSTMAYLSMLTTFLVGASFIGAEYSSGSLANWLTFVPRRLRVFGSKAAAVVLGSAVLGAVLAFTTTGLLAFQVVTHGEHLVRAGHVAAATGRVVPMAAVAGLVGFALALVTRHTVAALGIPLAYLIVRTVLAAFTTDVDAALAWLPPYLPDLNLQAFLEHGTTYTQYRQSFDGNDYEEITKHVSFLHGSLYWVVVTALALVPTALVFRRRDVT